MPNLGLESLQRSQQIEREAECETHPKLPKTCWVADSVSRAVEPTGELHDRSAIETRTGEQRTDAIVTAGKRSNSGVPGGGVQGRECFGAGSSTSLHVTVVSSYIVYRNSLHIRTITRLDSVSAPLGRTAAGDGRRNMTCNKPS
jgi:hypothetical protein